LGAGFFSNPLVDEDGVFRRVPLLHEYQGALYESLALATARTYLASPVELVMASADQDSGYTPLEALSIGPVTVGLDENAAALIPYRGPRGSYRYISAHDVLNETVKDQDDLAETIALIGTTAVGLMDTRATPVQSVYPGVEVQANVISGIMDESFKNQPAYMLAAEIVWLIVLGISLALLLPALSPTWMTAAFLFALSLFSGLSFYFWQQQNVVIPVAKSFLIIFGLYIINATYGFFIETRIKQQLSKRFGQYVPPELVAEMSKDPSRYSLEAEKRDMTVLFTDVRGFTTISESLNPKDLSDLMNTFLTEMTTIVHKHRGTIDKYMGDAMMAFWGAPVQDPAHASHAIGAALEMITALREVNQRFRERGWPEIAVGVGINTGEMNVGNMGSEFRMAYTVMGDAVNLGSRLEGLTKQYGVKIIVSEITADSVPEYLYREIDRVRVKGKSEPVTIFEPLGPASSADIETKHEIRQLQEALADYRAQRWDMAENKFRSLWEKHQDTVLYEIYLKRIGHFRENPPAGKWDGVFTHLLK
jgi:adenylate cyclase